MTAGWLGRRELLAAAGGAIALACTPARARGARAPRVKRGGILRHVALEPWTFDIHASPSPATQMISSLVRRTLVRSVRDPRSGAPDLGIGPDLAVRWRVSPDGRTYTFALRPAVRWERKPPVDGRELVAADVKYTLERALRRSPEAPRLGPIDAVETPDARTVRVQLRAPFAPLLATLAEPWLAVLPPEVEDRFGDFRAAATLVGCGPFSLARIEPGVKAVLERNPDYYQPRLPHVDRLDWIFLRDRATQLSLFAAGQVDVPSHDASIPRAAAARLAGGSPPYHARFWDGLGVGSLALRVDRPPLADPRVRRALSLAVDRRGWVTEHLDGEGIAEPGPLPAPMREWRLPRRRLGEGARYLEHDPARARALLAEAGFPSGLSLRCAHTASGGPEPTTEMQLLSRSFERVGVALTIVSVEPGAAAAPPAPRPEETSWAVSPAFTDVDGFLYGAFRSGHPANRSQVKDPRLDELLEAERQAVSRGARRQAVADIQRHVAERVYYIYTPSPRSLAAWAPWVRDYAPRSSLDRGAQLEAVWLDR
jgi:ABC-type transport system substrate-binding protein